MKNVLKSCIATSSALLMLAGSAGAAERIKVLDRMMYTINPSAKASGPVFKDTYSGAERAKYASSVVRTILKEADKKARKYLEAGDTQAYYAFMTLGLTVPLHEGIYIQYRSVDGDVCNAAANSGELVKKAGETTLKYFNQYFKSGSSPYFPNCETMKSTAGVKQIIRGGDGTDLSMMQVSIRWHFDDFLANKKYESVDTTLNYGLGLLMSGFDPVYRNVANYKCISDAGLSRKKLNYINLVRGIWAGKYNSGSIAQTCRFADPTSPYKNHDIGFQNNLNKILSFSGSLPVDYIGEMKVEGVEAEAIKEIVNNLKTGKNDTKALGKILDI
jgi:hypothetical protein